MLYSERSTTKKYNKRMERYQTEKERSRTQQKRNVTKRNCCKMLPEF